MICVRTRHQAGVSLPETLMAVALIVLLGSQAAPAFHHYLERLTITATTKKVVALLRHAQQLAAVHQVPVSINIVPGDNWCLALSDQAVCDCASEGDCTVAGGSYVLSPPSLPLVFSSNRFSASRPAVFDNLSGSAFNSAGSFYFAGSSATASVIVSPLGRIRACARYGALTGLPAC
ncbi:GspH/FimT family pseudopilin [Alteromonas halophila]|uniref:GspH/FimT family pseudopilin n=1 Tax=Alteromonas halophila TaxID=516698 RepID=UPI0016798341|nr:GspH/FimT family pseudopilin [Alteromonas halophila]